MVDECRIWKPGPMVTDRTSGKAARSVLEVKYEGVCRFWEISAGQQAIIGGEQLTLSSSYLTIPFSAPVPESDDIIKITKSVDPDLEGRTVRVVSVVRGGGLRASRRFLVQVIDSQKDTW